MRVTNLEQHFDKIICSHDYNAAKETQDFWQQLENEIKFNKTKSIFFDDSLAVLTSAKKYGIGTVIAINKPSSKIAVKPITGFINIETFEQTLPVEPH
ncbi:FIG001957: putative hydrolase [uncultured Candidatus Thioglobus sp.]|nr:FIG001957: putative hydrolase [uncultured Candidatus Thioglobus sp.]